MENKISNTEEKRLLLQSYTVELHIPTDLAKKKLHRISYLYQRLGKKGRKLR